MVQPRTVLKVIDNSGAHIVRCITVLRGPRAMGTVGHTIVCSVQKAEPGNKRIKRGDVHRALIVRAKNERARPDGSWFVPDTAACILVNASGNPIGNRIRGVVSKALLKNREYLKILTLAKYSM
mmetsp:Transcript_4456/g.13518  ORF Transcript_4456/g.13518 Transcript_4456/m.13518 type:complete len:124 (+) Transcript_4456:143-514(+)